jgi:hypothetical protein
LRSVRLSFRDSKAVEGAFEATVEARVAKKARHSQRFGQAVAETVEAEASAHAETVELLNVHRAEEAQVHVEAVEREVATKLLAIDEAREYEKKGV